MLIELDNNPACIACGLCREACPVFTILHQEHISPRGLALLSDQGIPSAVFYQCTLCRSCRVVCPVGHDPFGESIRAALVAQSVETDTNRQMIENIRAYGNPFGALREGEIPKNLYCC